MFILSAREGKPRAYRECNTEDTRRVIVMSKLSCLSQRRVIPKEQFPNSEFGVSCSLVE